MSTCQSCQEMRADRDAARAAVEELQTELTRERDEARETTHTLRAGLQDALTAWYNSRECDLCAWEERFPFLRQQEEQ